MIRRGNYLEKVKGRQPVQPEPLFDIAGKDFLLTAEDAGKRLAMSRFAVYGAAKRGFIPCVKIGTRVRFKDSDITKLISNSATS